MERVARSARLQDVGAGLFQRGGEDFKRILVVVHDQDADVGEIDRLTASVTATAAGAWSSVAGSHGRGPP